MNKILTKVLASGRVLTKQQIETAESALIKAFQVKHNELTSQKDKQVEKKYLASFKKIADKFNTDMNALEKKMKNEFGEDARVRTHTNSHNEDITISTIAIELDDNHPIYKVRKDIDDIVLGLKLGQDLYQEMIEIVNKINSIK